MHSRYDENEAKKCSDDLDLRVYTSRLLGGDENLVLHGGGNTSVKIDDYLFVKGSGWDLSTIERTGFPAVRMDALLEMANMKSLSDTDMVGLQREAMQDKSFPNPSIEAILHAVIPFKFVDHTHADAIVTISNTPNGRALLEDIFGKGAFFVPYIMPGFDLAKSIYEMTKELDWANVECIILDNHGVFTFSDDARAAYENMIKTVKKAQDYLDKNAPIAADEKTFLDEDERHKISRWVSELRGRQVTACVVEFDGAKSFCALPNLREVLDGGPLTPEHVIRIKPKGALLNENCEGIDAFAQEYREYFLRNNNGSKTLLDCAPRWAVVKNRCVVALGVDEKENAIISDIVRHTAQAMLRAQKLGGWKSLNEQQIFDMEYWELEQAKLRKAGS